MALDSLEGCQTGQTVTNASSSPDEPDQYAHLQQAALASEQNAPYVQMIASQRISDLQSSQASLATQVSHLKDALQALEHRISSISQQSRQKSEEEAMKKTLVFAKIRATSILLAGSLELSKRPSYLSQSNSVIQVMMKSPATHCTLREFQLLALRIRRKPSIRSLFYPSEYSVMFPSVLRTARLEICFDSYKDLCEALELDAYQSDAGIYRERCDL